MGDRIPLNLILDNGPEAGRTVALESGALLVGRTAASELLLHWDGLVSSRHFRIDWENGEYLLQDVGSTNGTYVNEQSVQAITLNDGDVIRAGSTKLVVQLGEHATGHTTANWHQPANSTSNNSAGPSSHHHSQVASPSQSPIEGSVSDFAVESPGIDTRRGRSVYGSSSFNQATIGGASYHSDQSALPTAAPLESLSDIQPAWQPVKPESPALSSSVTPAAATREIDPVITQVRLRLVRGLLSGADPGLMWLGPGQMITVGRSFTADYHVADDPQLSPHHFQLTCTPQACLLNDLGAETGTWVNNQRVAQTALFHSDVIRAGDTELTVEIQTRGGFLWRPAADRAAPVVIAPSGQSGRGRLQIKADLVVCQAETFGMTGKFPADQTARQFLNALKGLGHTYLLIDFSRLPMPYPDQANIDQSLLFSWLPAAAAKRSLHLLASEELAECEALVDEGWGCDAITILLSSREKPELLWYLRDKLRDPGRSGQRQAGVLGYCWPSMLRALLPQNAYGFSTSLMELVECVITEGPDPSAWSLFAPDRSVSEKLLRRFAEAGLEIQISSEAQAEMTEPMNSRTLEIG